MDGVQVIGDTIEYKRIPIAKLIRQPHVPPSVRDEFVDGLHEPTITQEVHKDQLLQKIRDLRQDPIDLEAIELIFRGF